MPDDKQKNVGKKKEIEKLKTTGEEKKSKRAEPSQGKSFY